MSSQNATVRCSYCLAVNAVPTGNVKCCCASCGRIFEISKAPKAAVWQASPIHTLPPEPSVVASPLRVNYRAATPPKIPSWPWPGLNSRSEESRHKFFSLVFRYLALISAPLFLLMLTFSIGYEVGALGLIVIIPLAFLSSVAMGLGQAWIVDNAHREGKTFREVWWIPGYTYYYILSRWAICWRPLGLITLGGAVHVSLLFYLFGDQLAATKTNNVAQVAGKMTPQTASTKSTIADGPAAPVTSAMEFSPATQMPPSRRSASGRNAARASTSNSKPNQPATAPSEAVWAYESLTAPTAPTTDTPPTAVAAQPVLSPAIESSEPRAAVQSDGFREWSSSTGAYKLIAKFDVVTGDFVQLETKAGRKVRVEIAKLSQADRLFLEPIVKSSPFEVVDDH